MPASQRTKTGIASLDAILGGGLPAHASMLVIGLPKSGKKPLMMQFIYEGLRQKIPAIIVLTDYSYEEWKEMMAEDGLDINEFEKAGLVRVIDAYSKQFEQGKEDTKICTYPESAGALSSISLHISRAESDVSGYGKLRVVFHSLSSLFENAAPQTVFRFLQFMIGKFRVSNTMSLFSLEKGMHDEKVVTMVESLMDGIIEFEGSSIRIRGIMGADHDWHEFKITNNGFEISGASAEVAKPKGTKKKGKR